MILLVTGGAASGKSAIAERLAASLPAGRRIYLATMAPEGEEAARRIARHRAQRAALRFETLERRRGIAGAEIPDDACVLLEDLPNLVANELFGGGDPDGIGAELRALAGRCRHLVMVTGDLFSDGIAYPEETRAYLRRLSQANRLAAELADAVCEAVCGIPVMLKGEAPCAF